MTATTTYTALHQAFGTAAHKHRTRPLCARIALALHEAGPDGLTSRELEHHLSGAATDTRHATALMVREGWLTASGRLELTVKGRALARCVVSSLRVQQRVLCAENVTPLRDLVEALGDVVGATTTGDGW